MKSISQYTEDNILVLPDALISMKDATLLYQQGSNAFFYKDLKKDLVNVEFYSNAPCVVYIESGQESITCSNNQQLTLDAGFATILPQGLNLHSDYVKSTHNLKAYLVFFDESIIRDFLKANPNFKSEPTSNTELIKINGSKILKDYFKTINTMAIENLLKPSLMRLKQLELLHTLNLKTQQSICSFFGSSLPKRSPKRNLQRLLSEHNTHHLSVTDLANLSGRSSASFNRDFKAIYNMSPKQWLQDKRLQHGYNLLSQNISVTQVASELGYDNTSHFISAFKKRYSITPKQFQKNA